MKRDSLPETTRDREALAEAVTALSMVPVIGVKSLDPRARVLCCAAIPRTDAAAIARGLPRPRRGFSPAVGLRDHLARMARAAAGQADS